MSAKSEAIDRLTVVLEQIPALKDLNTQSPEFMKWQRRVELAIANSFGENSRFIREFADITFRPRTVGELIFVERQSFQNGLVKAQIILEALLEEIESYWSDGGPSQAKEETFQRVVSNRVFVVHGRDDGSRNTVARFLESLELEPIILQERPNEGRTIIQKFEDHSGVNFAVVLCTPDDVGALATEQHKLRPRPRQNVILELGFFWGKLGRKKVCALLEGDMDMPSDFGGVLYIPLDESEGWKLTLARELRAAGMNIDLNRII